MCILQQMLEFVLTADLNVPEVLPSRHVVLDDEISVDERSLTIWTLPLLIHGRRERDARLTKGWRRD